MIRTLRALSCGRLCDTERVIVDGRLHYRKTRVCPDGLIELANRGPLHFDLLPSASWSRWEADFYARFYGRKVLILDDTSILVPELPGRTLHDILSESPDAFSALKSTAFRSAVTALATLHAVDVRYPDGHHGPFAHADATVRNVLFDIDSGTASWFDFETVYRRDIVAADRRASDFRALLFSAAALVPRRYWADLVDQSRSAYGDDAIFERVSALPRRSHFQSLFELTQFRLGARHRDEFANIIRRTAAPQHLSAIAPDHTLVPSPFQGLG